MHFSSLFRNFAMMNNIFSHIEYLLYSHDCVIVPHLGAFVVRHIPAEYHAASSTFLPPRRQILFNPELTHSDGLLAASVARRNRISYEQGAAVVADEVSKIKTELSQPEGRCSAGSLGIFMRLPHGAITFESSRRFFDTPVLFGLPEIEVSTVEQREAALQPARKSRTLTFPGFMRVAASIILLIIIGFLTTTPVTVNENELHMASLALPGITMPSQESNEVKPIEISLNIAMPTDSVSSHSVISPTELSRRNAGIRFDDADPYYLVVASSESATRARIFMGLHPDVHLETVNNNGNIRVIAATGESPQALRDLHREKLAEEFPDAWPCHR